MSPLSARTYLSSPSDGKRVCFKSTVAQHISIKLVAWFCCTPSLFTVSLETKIHVLLPSGHYGLGGAWGFFYVLCNGSSPVSSLEMSLSSWYEHGGYRVPLVQLCRVRSPRIDRGDPRMTPALPPPAPPLSSNSGRWFLCSGPLSRTIYTRLAQVPIVSIPFPSRLRTKDCLLWS